MESHGIVRQWLRDMNAGRTSSRKDLPNYWSEFPESLFTTCNTHGLVFGTGRSLFSHSILPAIEDAEIEVIIVTCSYIDK